MEEKIENQLCPQCGQLTMEIKGEKMFCNNCKTQIPIEVYMVSLQLLEKQLLISLLGEFMNPGVGKCISHKGLTYIVGFDQDGQLFTQPYDLEEGEQVGMFVSLKNQTEVLN